MKRLAALVLCALLLACGAKPVPAAEAQPLSTPLPTPEDAPEEVVVIRSESPTEKPVFTETPTDTPAPTPEPTPEPERIDGERLASGEFDSYFDDAVFVGDSITHSFQNYVASKRNREGYCLGEAKFLGVISMSALRAARNRVNDDGINFTYRGKARSLTDALEGIGAKKVFVLFGVNELEWCRWEDETAAFEKVIKLIRSVDPDTEIVIQAVLPVTERYCNRKKLDIEKWNSYNDVLQKLCEENGVVFLSFAEALMTDGAYLDDALSNDGQCHLNEQGNDIWLKALREYAARQTYPDAVFETQEGD